VEVNVTRVREIYEDFANGRLDRLSDVLDERIDLLAMRLPTYFRTLEDGADEQKFCTLSRRFTKSLRF
jgi:hypothetical protein